MADEIVVRSTGAGKGDKRRPEDKAAYGNNYERIFGRSPLQVIEDLKREPWFSCPCGEGPQPCPVDGVPACCRATN